MARTPAYKSNRRAARAWGTVGLTFAAACCLPAQAAQWETHGALDVGALRDDNINLVTGPHESTSGYLAAGRLDVKGNTETSKTDFSGFISRTDYSQGDLPNTSEEGATLRGQKQTSERGTLGLDLDYRHDVLFQTTLIRQGTGDLRDTDIGLTTNTAVQRNYRVLRPSWNWLLSERSSVQVSYRHTDVTFSNDAGTGLFDYKEDLASATYTHNLTARDDFNVTANAARFRPDVPDNEEKTVQLLGGFTRRFSERVRGSFALGASRTTSTSGPQEGRSSGVVANATLAQRSELSTLEGVISRDVTPSGIGQAVQTDQLRLFWKRELGPATAFVLSTQWFRNHVVEGSDSTVDRRYFDFSPELRWQWLENVYLVGSVRFRRQKFDVDTAAAESRAVFLGLSYGL